MHLARVTFRKSSESSLAQPCTVFTPSLSFQVVSIYIHSPAALHPFLVSPDTANLFSLHASHIMTTNTQNSTPFFRTSRKVFGFNVKSTRSTSLNRNQASDDESYIPYTGPYEQPREPRRRLRARDSWGDPIPIDRQNGEDELATIEPPKSHHVPRSIRDSRDAVHPRPTHRRSTSSPSKRPPAASYVGLGNTGGGVGESPVPVSVTKRTFLKDYNGSRISRAPTDILRRFSRGSPSTSPSPSEMGRRAAAHRRSISSGSTGILLHGKTDYDWGTDGNHPCNASSKPPLAQSDHIHPVSRPPASLHIQPVSQLTSLHNHPASQPPTSLHMPPVSQPPTSLPTPCPQHPYANMFPTSSNNAAPRVASLPSPRHSMRAWDRDNLPKSKNTPGQGSSSHGDQSVAGGSSFLSRGLKQLKNSMSNPDLRLHSKRSRSRSREPKRPSTALKATKDRWLTAETWCDALLFPRPRLRMRYDGDEGGVTSGWMVSPPRSPPAQGSVDVSAHSRSSEMGGPRAGPSKLRTSDERVTKRRGEARAGSSASPAYNERPRSFSLPVPPPVPSVAQ